MSEAVKVAITKAERDALERMMTQLRIETRVIYSDALLTIVERWDEQAKYEEEW